MHSGADIEMAARLIRQMIRQAQQPAAMSHPDYAAGVKRYVSEPSFESLVTVLAVNLGFKKPLRYDNDCLVLTPADKDSPFAMRADFFGSPAMRPEEKNRLLIILHAIICCFWPPDENLFGDHREAEWINGDQVRKFILDRVSAIKAKTDQAGAWSEIYRINDFIDAQRASSGNLSGLIARGFSFLEKAGLAKSRDYGAEYRPTPQLCAHLQSRDWMDFEDFLSSAGKKREAESSENVQ